VRRIADTPFESVQDDDDPELGNLGDESVSILHAVASLHEEAPFGETWTSPDSERRVVLP